MKQQPARAIKVFGIASLQLVNKKIAHMMSKSRILQRIGNTNHGGTCKHSTLARLPQPEQP